MEKREELRTTQREAKWAERGQRRGVSREMAEEGGSDGNKRRVNGCRTEVENTMLRLRGEALGLEG